MTIIFIIAGIVLAAAVLQSKGAVDDSSDLEKLLPIWKTEQDCILSKNGDVTVVLKVTLPEIFSLSNEDYEALHFAWLKAIKILPVNAVLHKQDWFMEAKYKANFSGEDSNFIKASSELFFNERPYLDHECYLAITLKPKDRKPASSAFSKVLR
jgi:hypothetical protein